MQLTPERRAAKRILESTPECGSGIPYPECMCLGCNAVKLARHYLSLVPADDVAGWQPIETAPVADEFLVYREDAGPLENYYRRMLDDVWNQVKDGGSAMIRALPITGCSIAPTDMVKKAVKVDAMAEYVRSGGKTPPDFYQFAQDVACWVKTIHGGDVDSDMTTLVKMLDEAGIRHSFDKDTDPNTVSVHAPVTRTETIVRVLWRFDDAGKLLSVAVPEL